MKKLLMLLAVVLLSSNGIAQEKTYLLFEFMRVDNEQEQAYAEVESFWEKIHEQRVKNGDIVGWDLWSLKPGGEDQGYQYMTVNVYNDEVKMYEGGNFWAAVEAAYPDATAEELNTMMEKSGKSRDLAVRAYFEVVERTKGDFEMKLGTVARIGFMKAVDNRNQYQKAEIETFMPIHQKMVDAGQKGRWEILRALNAGGSEDYVSHLVVNMFTGYDQFVNQDWSVIGELDDATRTKIDEGLALRDMKKTVLARLIKMVR